MVVVTEWVQDRVWLVLKPRDLGAYRGFEMGTWFMSTHDALRVQTGYVSVM